MKQLQPTFITRKSGKVIANFSGRDVCLLKFIVEYSKHLVGPFFAIGRHKIAPYIVQFFLGDFAVGFDDQARQGEQLQLKITRVDPRTPIIGINAGIGNQTPQKIADDGTRQTK